MNDSLIASLVGEPVYVQTATFYYVGTLQTADDHMLRLTDVVKVWETGPIDRFWRTGIARSAVLLPACDWYIGRCAVIVLAAWPHSIPMTEPAAGWEQ
jgi:small nuclear ribonucleoprotein (snRNP)-like protein